MNTDPQPWAQSQRSGAWSVPYLVLTDPEGRKYRSGSQTHSGNHPGNFFLFSNTNIGLEKTKIGRHLRRLDLVDPDSMLIGVLIRDFYTGSR
jgi:hypothetical protein